MATDRIRTPDVSPIGDANVNPIDPSTVDTTLQVPSDYAQSLQAGANLAASQFAPGVNLLPNGGFEQGLTGWTDFSWGAAITTLDTAQFFEGVQAATHNEAGWSFGGVQSDIYDIPVGALALQVSAQFRYHDNGTTDVFQAFLLFDFYDASGVLIQQAAASGMPIANDAWTYHSFIAEVPAAAVQFDVRVYGDNIFAGNIQVWFDDVQVTVVPDVIGTFKTVQDVHLDHSGSVQVLGDLVAFGAAHPSAVAAYIRAQVSQMTGGSSRASDIIEWLFQGPSNGTQQQPYMSMFTDPTMPIVEFGGRLRPINGVVNQKVGNVNWSNFTPALGTTFQVVNTVVGGTDIILPALSIDPSVQLGVMIVVVAHWVSLSAFQQCNIKLGIAPDGSTYTFGKTNAVDCGSTAGGAINIATTCTSSYVGFPTGPIKVQLQAQVTGGTSTGFTLQDIEARYVITPSI